jgi:hypothetical protein
MLQIVTKFTNRSINRLVNYDKPLENIMKFFETKTSAVYKEKFIKMLRIFAPENIDYDPKKEFHRYLDDVLTNIFLKHKLNKLLLAADLGYDFIFNKVTKFSDIIKAIVDEKLLTLEYAQDMDYRNLGNRRTSVYEPLIGLISHEVVGYIFETISSTIHKIFRVDDYYLIKALFNDHLRPINVNQHDIATPYSSVLAYKSINFDGDEDRIPLEYRIPNESFLNRICLVSTSSQKPGIDLHMVPDLKLNFFGYISDLYKPRFS